MLIWKCTMHLLVSCLLISFIFIFVSSLTELFPWFSISPYHSNNYQIIIFPSRVSLWIKKIAIEVCVTTGEKKATTKTSNGVIPPYTVPCLAFSFNNVFGIIFHISTCPHSSKWLHSIPLYGYSMIYVSSPYLLNGIFLSLTWLATYLCFLYSK